MSKYVKKLHINWFLYEPSNGPEGELSLLALPFFHLSSLPSLFNLPILNYALLLSYLDIILFFNSMEIS